MLHKGTFWVRRSAGNHLADASDLDAIYVRRNERFRDSLVSKIARVVEAPPDHEVLVVSTNPTAEGETRRFTITDAPGALEVKGLSVGVVPVTDEHEIASWIAMSGRDAAVCPPASKLCSWYSDRDRLKQREDQRIALAEFSLRSGVPAFYWIQQADVESIKGAVRRAAASSPTGLQLTNIVGTSAFLGKRFHASIVEGLGNLAKGLPARYRRYPDGDPAGLMGAALIQARRARHGSTEDADRRERLKELDDLLRRAKEAERPLDPVSAYEAVALDCFVYAKHNEYA